MCLLALLPESKCKCRCDGAFHGAAAEADIGDPDLTVVRRVDDGEFIERLLLTMTNAEKRRWALSRGWERVGNSWVHPSRPHAMATLAYVVRAEMRRDIEQAYPLQA
jgi:hypothetical protein